MFGIETEEDKLVEKARKLAVEAHKGQHRWGGEPFIVHPEGVVKKLRGKLGHHLFAPDYLVVGWLHDVVEDTDTTLGNLLDEGFSYEIVKAVDTISRRDNEEYLDYILRVREDFRARKVKMADIEHNLESFDHKKNKSRADKYKLAIEILKME